MKTALQRPHAHPFHARTPCTPTTSYAIVRSIHRRLPCTLTRASKSTVSSSLLSVLKDELKYAREAYRRDEELLEEPPNDFELDNPPGKRVFYLMKEYSKQEQIIIEVDLDAQPSARDESDEDELDPDDDEDEEGEEVPPVAFKVQINKENSSLTFECESNGEYVVILDLSLERPSPSEEDEDEEDDEDIEEDEPYSGPVFEELDDTLQQAFLDYLEERGVTAELGEYIRLMAQDKAGCEYQMWLQHMQEFIAH